MKQLMFMTIDDVKYRGIFNWEAEKIFKENRCDFDWYEEFRIQIFSGEQ